MVDRSKLQAFYAQESARKQAEAAARSAANKKYADANAAGAQYFKNSAAHKATASNTGTRGTATGTGSTTAGSGGGLKALFSNPLAVLGTAWDNVESGKGIMPDYSKYANIGLGINAASNLADGISNYSNAVSDTDQLVADILSSAGSNSNLRYDLSADQLQLLRKLRNGTYDTSAGFSLDGLFNNLGDIAKQAGMGYLSGGWLGAGLGALGGAAEGITSGMTADQGRITSELEGLYNALYESEMRDKAMRRDAAMQRYANSIY